MFWGDADGQSVGRQAGNAKHNAENKQHKEGKNEQTKTNNEKAHRMFFSSVCLVNLQKKKYFDEGTERKETDKKNIRSKPSVCAN